MIYVDEKGDLACATSTNGLMYKVSGRVGDTPIPGSGCYVDNEVGGAGATGDGDTMVRFLPARQATFFMEMGKSPQESCELALLKIAKYYPDYVGGLVCVNKAGEYGGACYNWNMTYSVFDKNSESVQVYNAPNIKPNFTAFNG